jgi:hypothetical protein
MGAAFLLQYLAAEFSGKRFSGGKVGKAPAKIIVLIIAAAGKELVLDTALPMKLVHVV